jgi:hypothetical protein
MLLSFVACIVIASVYFYRYCIIVGDDEVVVSVFTSKRFQLSEIADVSIEAGRVSPSGVIRFRNGDTIKVSSYISGFDSLVSQLKAKSNRARPTP